MPVTLAVVAAAFMGCAGSKSSSSSSMDSSMSAEPSKNQKLEDARRSAEEAEMKAHQLRTDKNNTTSKSGK